MVKWGTHRFHFVHAMDWVHSIIGLLSQLGHFETEIHGMLCIQTSRNQVARARARTTYIGAIWITDTHAHTMGTGQCVVAATAAVVACPGLAKQPATIHCMLRFDRLLPYLFVLSAFCRWWFFYIHFNKTAETIKNNNNRPQRA